MVSGEGGALAGALFGWWGCVRCASSARSSAAARRDQRGFLPLAVPLVLDDEAATRVPTTDSAPAEPAPARVPPLTGLPTPLPESISRVAAEEAAVNADGASEPAAALFQPAGPPEAPPRDRLAPLKQWLFGGNTIVKAGIGILFVGLAFLAKYASEHADLPVELRLAGIGAAALALLAFGWRLRLRRPDYAQVLQGGAIAVLYLTLFAAFRYYGVLAAAPAFALMVAVAAFAAALAVLQNARALAVIGALGGFATPLIVSTGSDNHVALFTYYFVLDAGIAAVAWFKTWRSLNVLGFAATFIVATAWGVLRYRPEEFASSQAFLIAFFLLFVLILVLPARRRRASPAPGRSAATPGSTAACCSACRRSSRAAVRAGPRHRIRAPLSALAFGGFYVLLAAWMKEAARARAHLRPSLAIATIFLTLVIPFALDERSTAGAWTLEGAGLIWMGFRQRRGLPRVFGYALLLLGGLSMLLAHERYGAPTQLLNAYLFNGLMASAAALRGPSSCIATRAGRPDQRRGSGEPLLIGLASVWLGATAMVPRRRGTCVFTIAAVLACAAAATVVYALLSTRLDWPMVGWPARSRAVPASDRGHGGSGSSPTRCMGRLVGMAALPSPRTRSCFDGSRRAGRRRSLTSPTPRARSPFALLGALLGRALTEAGAAGGAGRGSLAARSRVHADPLPAPGDGAPVAGSRPAGGLPEDDTATVLAAGLWLGRWRRTGVGRIGRAAAAPAAPQPARHRHRSRPRGHLGLAARQGPGCTLGYGGWARPVSSG